MRIYLLLFVPMIALVACHKDGSMAITDHSASSQIVGADKDVHGCIGSAGYAWCNHNKKCERPWELAKQENFANTKEAFDTFCK